MNGLAGWIRPFWQRTSPPSKNSLEPRTQEKVGRQAFKVDQSNALGERWQAERCPHCQIHRPNLSKLCEVSTYEDRRYPGRVWGIFICANCGGVALVAKQAFFMSDGWMSSPMAAIMYPSVASVSDSIPDRARKYLAQAIEGLAQPDAAVVMAGSAVDAMLKAKDLKEGSVYSRIKQATDANIITQSMADWADEVRLAANEQRHADENFEHCTVEEAKRLVEFALALGEFLFVLPARIERGRSDGPPRTI